MKAMKQVAGSLRLDLAQFRELEAFAQFGSDLDKVTQAQLARGTRLVEILKQPQYEPMPVEKQVAIIFAATNGFIGSIRSASTCWNMRNSILSHLETSHPDVLTEIKEKKVISADLEAKMKNILEDFKGIFTPPELSIV